MNCFQRQVKKIKINVLKHLFWGGKKSNNDGGGDDDERRQEEITDAVRWTDRWRRFCSGSRLGIIIMMMMTVMADDEKYGAVQ